MPRPVKGEVQIGIGKIVANSLNQGLTKEKLYVKNIMVNKGPSNKKYYFKAMGRIGLIRKQTSHIELNLASKNGS